MATVAQLATKVEKKLKTIEFKGKPYVEVNERVRYFRENYPNWSIVTDIISLENGIVIMKTTISDENGVIKSTGMAQEKENSSFINKTSFLENCETSSVGRALGFLGIGIDTSIASCEEVQNAVLNQVTEKNICPICGKPTSEGALKNWGMCAKCKANKREE